MSAAARSRGRLEAKRSSPEARSLVDGLRSGEERAGPFINFGSPGLVELMGHVGFDFVVIDAMHTSFSAETVEGLIRAADAALVPALVRVHHADEPAMVRALEAGARGLVIAEARDAKDLRPAVAASRFPPLGERGACPSVRAAAFQMRDEDEFQADSNEHTILVALVETEEALENSAELLGLEQIDAFVLGPYDLASALGVPGDFLSPTVTTRAERFLAEAVESDRIAGVHLFQGDESERWRPHGATVFTMSSMSMIRRAAAAAAAELGKEK